MITTESKTIESMYIDVAGKGMIPVTILGDYRENGASGVVDAGTFTAEEIREINEAGIAYFDSALDGWNNPAVLGTPESQGGACTCCIKKLNDGTVIMGRNMDLPISFAPIVIFRTQGDGISTYDTVNLTYSAPGQITFDQVAELGAIPRDVFPYMAIGATDVLNSQGLYLEINMRECVDCACRSTNPDSDRRVVSYNLVRLLGDHCATIDEALAYLHTLDIFDPKSARLDWSMAIAMMDRTGKYGVVEFVNDRVVWNEGRPGFACGQANFYWSPEASQRFGAGKGRWRKLMEYYYDIENQDDMVRAMERIWYSNLFTDGTLARDWKVDWITETNDKIPNMVSDKWLADIYTWRDQYGIEVDERHLQQVLEIEKRHSSQESFAWTADYLNDPANYYDVMTVVDLYIKCFAQLPIEAQKLSGAMECSTISYTASTKDLELVNRFFEMNDVYHVGLYETKIDRVSGSKVYGKS